MRQGSSPERIIRRRVYSLIFMADEIIVLNKEGCIVEVGRHEKLLEKNGAYKEFWDKRGASSQWRLA